MRKGPFIVVIMTTIINSIFEFMNVTFYPARARRMGCAASSHFCRFKIRRRDFRLPALLPRPLNQRDPHGGGDGDGDAETPSPPSSAITNSTSRHRAGLVETGDEETLPLPLRQGSSGSSSGRDGRVLGFEGRAGGIRGGGGGSGGEGGRGQGTAVAREMILDMSPCMPVHTGCGFVIERDGVRGCGSLPDGGGGVM